MNRIDSTKIIRKNNRKILLKVIRKKQVFEQSHLIKETGLSKQTVNTIIIDLIEEGLILEDKLGKSTKKGGRKPMVLKFNPSAYYLAGILVGENRIRCGITDLNGNLLLEKFIPADLDRDVDVVIQEMLDLYKRTISEIRGKTDILGLGIGLPGIVDFENGIIRIFTRHTHWKDIHLKKIFQEEINIPVILDNEAVVRAIGEKWFGLGVNKDNFITIMTRDDGIGAGIVIDGEIYRGRNYLSGQLGHMFFGDCEKFPCNFEYYLGYKNIKKIIIDYLSKNDNVKLKSFIEVDGSNLKTILRKFNENGFIPETINDELTSIFAFFVSDLVGNFDLETLILQGVYSELEEEFFRRVIDKVDKLIFPDLDKDLKIITNKKSKEMGLKGTASMVLDTVDV